MKAGFKYGHLVLSVIVLINTAGIPINKHYCKNELKSVALFVPAPNCHSAHKSCENEQQKCKVHQRCSNQLTTGNCCSDQTVYFKSTQDLSCPIQKAEWAKKGTEGFNLIAQSYSQGEVRVNRSINSLAFYHPPPIINSLPILFQNFRF